MNWVSKYKQRAFAVLLLTIAGVLCLSLIPQPRLGWADEGDATLLQDRAAKVDPEEVTAIPFDVSGAVGTSDDGNSAFADAVAGRDKDTPAAATSVRMEDGVSYTITYPDAITWGQKLTVVATVKMVKDGRLDAQGNELRYRQINVGSDETPSYRYLLIDMDDPDYGKADEDIVGTTTEYDGETYEVRQVSHPSVTVCQAADGRLSVSWSLTDHTEVEWTVSTLDASGNPVGTPLLMGILDPDESDYLFDTTGRGLFYELPTDGDELFAERFEVDDNGIYPLNANGVRTAIGFSEGKIFASMGEESSFNFKTMTYSGGYLATPYFYAPFFQVTYELDDGDGTGVNDPDNPAKYEAGESYQIKDPTRPGYEFVRWDRLDENGNPVPYDKIDSTDARDLHFIARWKHAGTWKLDKIRVEQVGDTNKASSLIVPGSEAVYLVTLANTGQTDIAAGLQVIDKPGDNLTLVAATTENGTAELNDEGNVVWTLGEIPVGQTAQMWVTAQVPDDAKGQAVNTATATDPDDPDSPDPDDPDNPGTTVTVEDPVFDIEITKTANKDGAKPGDTITYSIVVTNKTSVEAKDMLVADEMGKGLQYVSDDAKGTNNDQKTTWTQTIPANSSVTIQVKAKVTDEATGSVVNTATVTDPNNPDQFAQADCVVPLRTNLPKTGDEVPLVPYTLMLVAGGAACVIALRHRISAKPKHSR